MRGHQIIRIFKALDLLSRPGGATNKELLQALGKTDRKAFYRLQETLESLLF